jgi:endo-1,4-beta-D-glucanase Y
MKNNFIPSAWKMQGVCLMVFVCGSGVHAQLPQKPFPQHVSYAAGSIRPVNYNQVQLDNSVKAFYDQWKTKYLRNDCGIDQYYVWFDEYSTNNSICVSEGQGYGMIITALMAGYDPGAKTYFDGLYHFYKSHPSVNNNHLMAWNQVSGCIDDPDGGNDSAADGDMDIAFALLLADEQWGSSGTINYRAEAIALINAVKQEEINQSLWIPTQGDWVAPGSAEYDDSRTSDFMMDHFRAFRHVTGDNSWNNILNECYSIVSTMQTNFSPNTGLLPDFVVDLGSSMQPAAPYYLEGEFDGNYYYNACRTPMRISMDYLLSGDIRAKNAVQKMNAWIKTKTGNNPAHIRAGYYLNGNDIPDNNYESAAFAGPFAVAAMVDVSNQDWLNNSTSFLLSLELQDYTYYDNTLKLLCMLVLSGNYWAPQGVQGFGDDISLKHPKIIVYPNPFRTSLSVYLDNTDYDMITFTVLDVYGKTLYTGKNEHDESNCKHTIDLNFLPEGIYLLMIEIKGCMCTWMLCKSP